MFAAWMATLGCHWLVSSVHTVKKVELESFVHVDEKIGQKQLHTIAQGQAHASLDITDSTTQSRRGIPQGDHHLQPYELRCHGCHRLRMRLEERVSQLPAMKVP